jgi:hypothetical protein
MRRIIALFTLVVLMTTMLAVGAGPASAIIIPDKEGCKAAKEGLKAAGSNQGQCIKFTKDSPVLLPY